ncbi:MAG: SPOR domain-containing protein [Gemmatimonadota bacterium]
MNRLLVAVMALGVLTTSLRAQDDSRLVAAVRLAQDGRGDSARAIVLGLMTRTPPVDTLYPQVVYTMGLVARDPGDRSRNFRRVAIEFAGSNWADDALLGLAQEDFAAGRAEESRRSLQRIRADYPSTPLLPVVAYWAARANFELHRTAEACRWLNEGLAMAGEDVELQNQFSFYQPRCAGVATAPATNPTAAPTTVGPSRSDTTMIAKPPATPSNPAIPATTTEPPVQSTTGSTFSVQVAAVASDAAAEGTVRQLRDAGYEPHLAHEGGYVKIRVGKYPDRAQAAAAASQIRARLGGSPFVVEER